MKFYSFVRLLYDIAFYCKKERRRGGEYLFLQTMLRQICRMRCVYLKSV